jgi:hypothetical protein
MTEITEDQNPKNSTSSDHVPLPPTQKQPLPPELEKKFNWGAFLLNWIWGSFHGYYWPLLVMPAIALLGLHITPLGASLIKLFWIFVFAISVLPFLAYIIYLGKKGNKIAWERREWRDIEHFKSVQKKWAIVGVIIGLLSIVIYLFILYFFAVIFTIYP